MTSAPAVKAELRRRLGDRPALTGVQVTWGAPVEHEEGEVIYLGKVTTDEAWATNVSRDEIYVLEVVISVMAAFDDEPQGVAERAFELFDELRAVVSEDRQLGCTVSESIVIDGWELMEPANAKEAWREAAVTVRVRCKNRLTP